MLADRDVIIFVYEVPFILWHYINVDEVSWITFKTLLQSAMDSYYKLRQLFYYKVRHGLLQIATGITKCDEFITNCDRYDKVRWLLPGLLQIATVHSAVTESIYPKLKIGLSRHKSRTCSNLILNDNSSHSNFQGVIRTPLVRLI